MAETKATPADDLRAYYAGAEIPKTYRVKKAPSRLRGTAKPKAERDRITEVRQYIIGRERDMCRCCRTRRGASMHEMKFRSQGGKISKKNSIWVCGDGVQGCHGLIHGREIAVDYRELGAEGVVQFLPRTEKARDWMKLGAARAIESGPMSHYEEM